MEINRRDFIKGAIAIIIAGAGAGAAITTGAGAAITTGDDVKYTYPDIIKIMEKYTGELMFENNDEINRKWWHENVHRDIEKLGYKKQWCIICDETNNTPEIIDAHGFIGSVLISDDLVNKPAIQMIVSAGPA